MLYTLEASAPNLKKQIQDVHEKVLGKKNVVILLFAHWCGHCQMFMGGPDSTWAKLVKQYRTNPNVDLIQLEDTVYSQLRSSAPPVSRTLSLPIQLSQMGIQGFPTLAFIYPRATLSASATAGTGTAPFRIYDDNRSLESCKLFINQGILRSGAAKTKPKSASAKPKPTPKPKPTTKPKTKKK